MRVAQHLFYLRGKRYQQEGNESTAGIPYLFGLKGVTFDYTTSQYWAILVFYGSIRALNLHTIQMRRVKMEGRRGGASVPIDFG